MKMMTVLLDVEYDEKQFTGQTLTDTFETILNNYGEGRYSVKTKIFTIPELDKPKVKV